MRPANNTGITINYAGAAATDGFLNVTTLSLLTDVALSGGPTAWRGTQPTTVNVLKHPNNPLGSDLPVASEPQGGRLDDGVAFVATGGTVNVGPGTFLLPATVTINKALTLNGNNAGINPVTAPGSRTTGAR